jgi:urease alpha subunit
MRMVRRGDVPAMADATGGDFYTAMGRGRDSHSSAMMADDMRKAGIPGIRYLDGGSRGAGQGTYNYVVFPGEENLLTILERNGVPLR